MKVGDYGVIHQPDQITEGVLIVNKQNLDDDGMYFTCIGEILSSPGTFIRFDTLCVLFIPRYHPVIAETLEKLIAEFEVERKARFHKSKMQVFKA